MALPPMQYVLPKNPTHSVERLPEDTKSKVEDIGSKSKSGLHQFFTGVRNSVDNLATRIGSFSFGKLITAINEGLLKVFNRKPQQDINDFSTQNLKGHTKTTQLSSGDIALKLLTETKQVLFDKFADPEKMASYILSTLFNDGGDCPKSRLLIECLKKNLLDTHFSTNNSEYFEGGMKLKTTPAFSSKNEESIELYFDERKLKETPYLVEFMKENSFGNVRELAEKVIKDPLTANKLFTTEYDKFVAKIGLSSGLTGEEKQSLMADIKPAIAPESANVLAAFR